jgi:hypothetical protein
MQRRLSTAATRRTGRLGGPAWRNGDPFGADWAWFHGIPVIDQELAGIGQIVAVTKISRRGV